MRSGYQVDRAVDLYADTVKRICFCHLKCREDAEDIFQEVFLKYMLHEGEFESGEHEKAWLIRVSLNACKDRLRGLLRRSSLSLEEVAEQAAEGSGERRELLSAVLALPVKYRDVIYLHYYEGYTAAQIAQLLRSRENTVYSLLKRGRDMLRKALGGEDDD